MDRSTRTALAVAAAGVGTLVLMRALRPRPFDYRGKVVVVTGGSRGLGFVLTRQLLERGARVAICGRDRDTLARAEQKLRRHGARLFAQPCDVRDAGQVQHFVRTVEALVGPIDVLINNAGIISVGPIEEATRADYEDALATHFWGPYNLVEAVLPGMRQRRRGRIVNISSIGGKIAVPHLVPYSVSKFALTGYSLGLRAELAKDGIVVTTVCPGLMRTGSPRNAFFKGQNKKEYAWFKVSDSLPLVTASDERAAEQILRACARGEAELDITVPAAVAIRLYHLFPEISAGASALVNRLLPGPGGIGREKRPGRESESPVTESFLTGLTRRAARRNNEVAGPA
jgi:NAD(P)-dependent dehydrogenase (short-subunit alcohol dehydrogenase family)